MKAVTVRGHGRKGKQVRTHVRKIKAKSFRDLTTKKRTQLAAKKEAMPDGSFPIANVKDLANAIKSVGLSKNPIAAKAWIKKRAKDLKATKQLPASWG